MDEKRFDQPSYRRTRGAFYSECVFAYLGTILLAETYLAKLLTALDFSDALTGVVSSLVTFSNMAMLLSIYLINRAKNLKRTVLICAASNMLFFLLAYLIPFMQLPRGLTVGLVFLSVGGGYFVKSLANPIYERWINFFVSPSKRSVFRSVNNMISLVCSIILSLCAGFAVDRYTAAGDMEGCFRFLAVLIGIFTVGDVVSLLLMENADAAQTTSQRKSLREVFRVTFRSKGFRCMLLMRTLYTVGTSLTTGFASTFLLSELGFRFSFLQIMTIAGSVIWLIFSVPVARLADRTTYLKGYRIGIVIAFAAFCCLFFAGPGCRWLGIAYLLVLRASNVGTGAVSSNLLFDYVPEDCYAQATAICGVIYGLTGILTAVVAGRILDLVQHSGNTVFGLPLYGQNLLALLSALVLAGTYLYTRLILEKQPTLRLQRDGSFVIFSVNIWK